jgi:hypothetical protein
VPPLVLTVPRSSYIYENASKEDILSAPFTRERRRSPRRRVSREAHLYVSHALLDPSLGEDDSREPLTFFGSTRDISATGFAVAVPYLNVAGRRIAVGGKSISFVLYLPAAQVRVNAIPVRVEPLNANDPSEGCLIGADVADMDEPERDMLSEYLRQVE